MKQNEIHFLCAVSVSWQMWVSILFRMASWFLAMDNKDTFSMECQMWSWLGVSTRREGEETPGGWFCDFGVSIMLDCKCSLRLRNTVDGLRDLWPQSFLLSSAVSSASLWYHLAEVSVFSELAGVFSYLGYLDKGKHYFPWNCNRLCISQEQLVEVI